MAVYPVVPLRGLIVFPHTTITIDVGRKKSLAAFTAAMQRDGQALFCAQKELSLPEPTAGDIRTCGTVCRILQRIDLPNKNVRLLVQGLYRVRIKNFLPNEEFLEAEADRIEITNDDTVMTEALFRKARELLATFSVNTNGKINKDVLAQLAEKNDPNEFIDLLSHLVVYHDSKKQEILEIGDTEARLTELCNCLANEIEIAKVDKKIASDVKESIDKGQKEFYLKEQMKAISQELGSGEDEIVEIENKIKAAKMPKEVEEKALKELGRLAKMPAASPDASVSRSYIEWLTDLEWNEETVDNKDLKRAREILDEDHFGLEKIKERILEYLAVIQLTGKIKGPILCFVGPPGVGKTSIVRSIARALNRKYVRMSLGGVSDEAEIRGHRKTYVGSMPGKIIYLMKQAHCINPVMLFDEIDKMSRDYKGDPSSAMLEVLDPEQNNSFVDHYLEVPFDLSKTLFVATANKLDSIPAPLLDRMEVIELSGYTEEEKLSIAKDFLIKKEEEQNGLPVGSLNITDNGIRKIIESYTRESGVRTLERELAKVCRKKALALVEGKDINEKITEKNVSDYLGVEIYKNDVIDTKDEVGTATGLAWTAVGGVSLSVDVTLVDGKGEILLTGMMGDVMKESARTAISLVKSLSKDYGINGEVFAKTDIHVHIPEGAIPKDGPSAGITMATAIMSAFTGRAVSKKVAMTGEVTLRGKVLPIGGLKEKTLAAFRVGIKKVIIPKDNEKDLQEIPKEVRDNMTFVLAEDIKTVFDNSLI